MKTPPTLDCRRRLTCTCFVAPEEESDLKRIERAVGRRLPRVTVPDFDYRAKPEGKLEVPVGERIAAIKARKAVERRGRR